MTDQPIEHCYWVSPGKLLAGEYPGSKGEDSTKLRINALTGAGVSAGLLKKVPHQRFPIRDVSIPDSSELMVAILDAIDYHLSQERVVYIHCWGGVGRTGVIVGCWLARHGFKGQAALDRLHELWSQCPKSVYRKSPETREQEEYILRWEETP